MTREELTKIIQAAADKAAQKTLNRLKEGGRITYVYSDSFTRTEELLKVYPYLPEGEQKARIDRALKTIENDDYKDVIASRYFDAMTIAQIAEIYGCKYQNISKHRNKLVRQLARALYPELVAKELDEQ